MVRQQWVTASLMGLALCGLASGCKPAVDPQRDDRTEPKAVATAPQTPKVEDIAVDRAQLLRALTDAASAAAVGEEDGSVEERLNGRQFVLKMPVGCDGESDAAAGWIYDSASQRLTLKATPDIALDDIPSSLVVTSVPPSSQTAADVPASAEPSSMAPASSAANPPESNLRIEAVDGFWINQPWILSDRCPMIETGEFAALDESAQEPTLGSRTVAPQFGIAQFYTSKDPRTGRRGGQPYRITKKVSEAEQPDPKSLRLVLRGRLSAPPGRPLIDCNLSSPDSPPRCIIAASFDRVSFENADGSIVYGQWGGR